MRFLHYSKVCTEVCVKYGIEAESAKSRNHLALYGCTHRIAECLSERCSYCGSCLYNNYLFWICKCVPYLVRIVLFCKRTCRTSCYTLTARYAGSLGKIKVKRTVNACLEASVVCADYADTLELVAGGDTTAAVNALVVVTEHMLRAVVNIVLVLLALEKCRIVNTKLLTQLLKLTASVS